MQELFLLDGSAAYYRVKQANAWSSWQRIDNFGCTTAADLATLLGALHPISMPNNTSPDDIHGFGYVYVAGSQIEDGTLPGRTHQDGHARGIIFVLEQGTCGWQIWCNGFGNAVYWRISWSSPISYSNISWSLVSITS